MDKNSIHNYEDILYMPRHVSQKHKRMDNIDRAAQFAPFAALTGHKERIQDTALVVDEKRILDENQLSILNAVLQRIIKQIIKRPKIKIMYFVPSQKKKGGEYVSIINTVKKIDEYERCIVFVDNTKIAIDDIYQIKYLEDSE